jgi:hypothetical protein
MIAIRKMVAQGRSYKDIMAATTFQKGQFFMYLSQTFKHDQQLLQEQKTKRCVGS